MSQQNTTNSNRPPLPSGFRLKEPGEVEYVIEKTLSTTGGFGITYLATELFMKRTRAVVLKENYPTDTAWRNPESGTLTPYNETEKFFRSTYDKFLREAQIIRHLEHPNIVRVYSAFEALGTAYYTMPYLEGAKELWQAAPTPDKIDEAWLLPILQKLLGALDYLHDFELLHRDLKTNNIMLLQDGTPVIIDFGIARSISAGVSTTLQIGTPGFSPIEQGAHTAAAASDLYSLGATCYALITGKIPPIAQNRLLGTDPYEPLCNMAKLNGRFNQELLSSIDRALQIMPSDRWQSAQDWLNALPGNSPSAAIYTPTVGTIPPRQPETNYENIVAKAKQLIDSKQYGGVPAMLRPVAESGYADAQNNLGDCYYYGHGVPQDYTKAVEWFQKAANQGNASAQYNLGFCYEKGRGVQQDYTKAVEWYKKAANQGQVNAQYNLGHCYEYGLGVQKNIAQAIKWYRKASQQGNEAAGAALKRLKR